MREIMKAVKWILVLVLFVSMCSLPVFATETAKQFEVNRLQGYNRIETAVKVAQELSDLGEKSQSSTIILVSGKDYTEAILTSGLSSELALNAPILLTDTMKLSQEVKDYLSLNKQIENVYIAGGPRTLSQGIDKELEDLGYDVRRDFGSNANDTARQIMRMLEKYTGGKETAFVVPEKMQSDALLVLLTAARDSTPMVYTEQNQLSEKVKEVLKDYQQIKAIGEISETVFADLTGQVEIVSSHSLTQASIDYAKEFHPEATKAYLVTTTDYPDALVTSRLAVAKDSVMLFVDKSAVDGLIDYLKSSKIEEVIIVGGVKAIPMEIEDALLKVRQGN